MDSLDRRKTNGPELHSVYYQAQKGCFVKLIDDKNSVQKSCMCANVGTFVLTGAVSKSNSWKKFGFSPNSPALGFQELISEKPRTTEIRPEEQLSSAPKDGKVPKGT